MSKLSRWLSEVFSIWVLKWHSRKLAKRIAEVNTLIESGEVELSFELCHMILISIPADLLAGVERLEENQASCIIRNMYIDEIIMHLDQCISYLEVEQHNNKLPYEVKRKRSPVIETRKYPEEWGEYSFGAMLSFTKDRYSSLELYQILHGRFAKITILLAMDPLFPPQQSYLIRMSNIVLEDCFVLISRLVGLSLNARITKRPKQVGENQ